MIYVDFVVHCDTPNCKRVEHVPVDDAICGSRAHVDVKIPSKWRQGQAGVYCEDHGPTEATT